ncbi:hypothetical protein ACK3TF_003260 [Chlorella vulgaris]
MRVLQHTLTTPLCSESCRCQHLSVGSRRRSRRNSSSAADAADAARTVPDMEGTAAWVELLTGSAMAAAGMQRVVQGQPDQRRLPRHLQEATGAAATAAAQATGTAAARSRHPADAAPAGGALRRLARTVHSGTDGGSVPAGEGTQGSGRQPAALLKAATELALVLAAQFNAWVRLGQLPASAALNLITSIQRQALQQAASTVCAALRVVGGVRVGLGRGQPDLFCHLPEPRTLHAFLHHPPVPARLANCAASLKLQWQVAHDAADLPYYCRRLPLISQFEISLSILPLGESVSHVSFLRTHGL